jgi:hypothetical protein
LSAIKRHLKASLRDRIRLITMVPYVAIRFPLAANNSYSLLIASLRNLFYWYAHISAPMPTRKAILELRTVTNIGRDIEPFSCAAFTDGCFRDSRCTGYITLYSLGTSLGSSEDRAAAIFVSITIYDDSCFFVVEGENCRNSARLSAPVVE